jgi:hypothetical protein
MCPYTEGAALIRVGGPAVACSRGPWPVPGRRLATSRQGGLVVWSISHKDALCFALLQHPAILFALPPDTISHLCSTDGELNLYGVTLGGQPVRKTNAITALYIDKCSAMTPVPGKARSYNSCRQAPTVCGKDISHPQASASSVGFEYLLPVSRLVFGLLYGGDEAKRSTETSVYIRTTRQHSGSSYLRLD